MSELDVDRLAKVLAGHRRWTGEYEALDPSGDHLASPDEFAAIIAAEYARLGDEVPDETP